MEHIIIVIAFSKDAWNIGQKKYKDFLAVHKMVKRMQKSNVACIDVSMWEIAQGPHFDDLQRLLESFWIPDTTSTDNFLLQYDLIIVPDPVLAKVCISGLSSSCHEIIIHIVLFFSI